MAHRPGHFKPFTDFLNQGMQNTNQNIYDMSMPSYGYSQFNNPYGQNQPGFMTQGFNNPYQQIGIGGDDSVMGASGGITGSGEGSPTEWSPDFDPGSPHGDPDYEPEDPPPGFDSWTEYFDHQEWLLTPEGQYQTHLDELTESGFYDTPDPGVGDPIGEYDLGGGFDFGLDFGEEEIEEGPEGSILPPGYGEGPYEFGHEIDPFADDFVPGEGEYSQPDLAGLLTDLESGIAGTGIFDDFDLSDLSGGEFDMSDTDLSGFDIESGEDINWDAYQNWEDLQEDAYLQLGDLQSGWLEDVGLFDDFELSDLSAEDFGSALAEGQSPFDIESPNPWLEYAQSAELAEDLGLFDLSDTGLFDDLDLGFGAEDFGSALAGGQLQFQDEEGVTSPPSDIESEWGWTTENNPWQAYEDLMASLESGELGEAAMAQLDELESGWLGDAFTDVGLFQELHQLPETQIGDTLPSPTDIFGDFEHEGWVHQPYLYSQLEHAGGGGTGGGLAKRLFYPTQETGMAAVGSGAQGGNTGLEALMKALQGG